MKVELYNKKKRCKLAEIGAGYCFLTRENEVCMKTNKINHQPWYNDDDVFCCIDDIASFVCVNLKSGELLNINPHYEVTRLNLKVVKEGD